MQLLLLSQSSLIALSPAIATHSSFQWQNKQDVLYSARCKYAPGFAAGWFALSVPGVQQHKSWRVLIKLLLATHQLVLTQHMQPYW